MRVLVACEHSQIVTSAFLAAGHDAFSCDLLPCSGPFPSRHLQCDARLLLPGDFQLVIAHPPCTYLSNAGVHLAPSRLDLVTSARSLFMFFYDLDVPYLCIENPRPHPFASLPPHSQVIQPYQFGDPYYKTTYLWLRGLPHLVSTNHVLPLYHWTDAHRSPTVRSLFHPGIAAAMAAQWSDPNYFSLFSDLHSIYYQT